MQRRFAWGLGVLGLAALELVAALAFEHSTLLDSSAVTVAYLVSFSLLQLGGVGLLWSDVGRRPLRWGVAVVATLGVGLYHLVLAHGPG